MFEYASPRECAVHVLNAFPNPEADAEMPSKIVADYFYRRNIPAAQCVIGIRHCVAMGWVQLLPEDRMRLLDRGVEFLAEQADIAERSSASHLSGKFSKIDRG